MIESTDRINHVKAFKWKIFIYFLVKIKEEETQVLKNNFWTQVCIFSLYVEASIILKNIWKENKFQSTVRRILEGNLYLNKYYISNKLETIHRNMFFRFFYSFYLLNTIFKYKPRFLNINIYWLSGWVGSSTLNSIKRPG